MVREAIVVHNTEKIPLILILLKAVSVQTYALIFAVVVFHTKYLIINISVCIPACIFAIWSFLFKTADVSSIVDI